VELGKVAAYSPNRNILVMMSMDHHTAASGSDAGEDEQDVIVNLLKTECRT